MIIVVREITLLSSVALSSASFALPTWDFSGYSVDRTSVKVRAAVYGNQSSLDVTKTGLSEGVDPAGIRAYAEGTNLLPTSSGGFSFGRATVQSDLSFVDGSVTYGGEIFRTGTAVPSLAQNIEFSLTANSDLEVTLSPGFFSSSFTSIYVNGSAQAKNESGEFSPFLLKNGDVLTTTFTNSAFGVSKTMSLTPVPEPVTVLSLGLGSALLIRRKSSRRSELA